MDVDSNTNTNEEASPSPSPPPSPNRRTGTCTCSSSKHIESAFRAAQDLMGMTETEDRATTNNQTSTTNHESCTTTGVSQMHAPDDLSSDSQEGKKADIPKSANDSNPKSSNFPPLTSSARGDDKPTQSDNNSDVKQHPDWPTEHAELTKRKSTTANDAISIKVGPRCLLAPSFFGVLDNETEEEIQRRRAIFAARRQRHVLEEERQRRRAIFAAKRQRHVLANNLHAHYEAILAAVSDEEQEPLPLQQDINNEDNAASSHQNAAKPARHIMAVAMDLFMEMETTDDEDEGKS